MAIAALPDYLRRQALSQASPGLRFGMYLPLWGEDRRTGELVWETCDYTYEQRGHDRTERRLPHENKVDAFRQVQELKPDDLARMHALAKRQSALAAPLAAQGRLLTLDAEAKAPFTTGLGNEHPLENGFAFLNPYGLPYLPGSGVKGVLRQAARELARGEWGECQGWREERDLIVTVGKQQIAFSVIDALFGLESDDGDRQHLRGALSFWDVLPQLAGDRLQVDVMTPHQTHYYQQRTDKKSGDSSNPHDSGQPNPIHFLTVPPGSGFAFHVQCDVPHLQRLAPALAEGGRWQTMLQAAFAHAFAWLGFGAKTAVGYGAMGEDPKARQKRHAALARAQAEAAAQAREEAIKAMSPADAAWAQAQPVIEAFRGDLARARAAGAYKPGQAFDQARHAFVKTALAWTEPRSRAAAGAALAESATKAWGQPSNKERKAELQAAINALRAPA